MTRGVAVLRAPLALTLLLGQTGLVRLTELIDLPLVLVEALVARLVITGLSVLGVAGLGVLLVTSGLVVVGVSGLCCLSARDDLVVLYVVLLAVVLAARTRIMLGMALGGLLVGVLVIACGVTPMLIDWAVSRDTRVSSTDSRTGTCFGVRGAVIEAIAVLARDGLTLVALAGVRLLGGSLVRVNRVGVRLLLTVRVAGVSLAGASLVGVRLLLMVRVAGEMGLTAVMLIVVRLDALTIMVLADGACRGALASIASAGRIQTVGLSQALIDLRA